MDLSSSKWIMTVSLSKYENSGAVFIHGIQTLPTTAVARLWADCNVFLAVQYPNEGQPSHPIATGPHEASSTGRWVENLVPTVK